MTIVYLQYLRLSTKQIFHIQLCDFNLLNSAKKQQMPTEFVVYSTTPENRQKSIAVFDTLDAAREKLSEICQARRKVYECFSNVHIDPKLDDSGKIIPHVFEAYRCGPYVPDLLNPRTVIEELGILVHLPASEFLSLQAEHKVPEVHLLVEQKSTEQKSTEVQSSTEQKSIKPAVDTVVVDDVDTSGAREKILMGKEYVEFVKKYFDDDKYSATSKGAQLGKIYRLDSLWSLSEDELSQLVYWIQSRIERTFLPNTVLDSELLNYLGTVLGRSALKDIVGGNDYLEAAKLMGYDASRSNSLGTSLPDWVGEPMEEPYRHLIRYNVLPKFAMLTAATLRDQLIQQIIDDLCAEFETDDSVELIKHIYAEDRKNPETRIPVELVMVSCTLIDRLEKEECKHLITCAKTQVKRFMAAARVPVPVTEQKSNTGSTSSASASSTTTNSTNTATVPDWRLAEYFNLLGNLHAHLGEDRLQNIYHSKAAAMGDANAIENIYHSVVGYDWLPSLLPKLDYLKLPI